MTADRVVFLAGVGSAALLLGALGFQYIGGLAPCPLCIWQRWPHVVAALVALAGFALPLAPVALAGGAAMLGGAGLGVYHMGVERDWWPGPGGCAGPSLSGLSPDEALTAILEAPLVTCGEVVWQFAGLSMAGWNAVLSLALAGLWLAAFQLARRAA